jgi:hypothetical protein
LLAIEPDVFKFVLIHGSPLRRDLQADARGRRIKNP